MKYIFAMLFSLLIVSCHENKQPENVSDSTTNMGLSVETGKSKQTTSFQIVPHEEVCMVNNAYMGKKQLEVKHNGKKYYGCCEMCQKRIPSDESVRMAVDPVSGKMVDKADAVIAVTGEKGAVSYFENETNCKTFFK